MFGFKVGDLVAFIGTDDDAEDAMQLKFTIVDY